MLKRRAPHPARLTRALFQKVPTSTWLWSERNEREESHCVNDLTAFFKAPSGWGPWEEVLSIMYVWIKTFFKTCHELMWLGLKVVVLSCSSATNIPGRSRIVWQPSLVWHPSQLYLSSGTVNPIFYSLRACPFLWNASKPKRVSRGYTTHCINVSLFLPPSSAQYTLSKQERLQPSLPTRSIHSSPLGMCPSRTERHYRRREQEETPFIVAKTAVIILRIS